MSNADCIYRFTLMAFCVCKIRVGIMEKQLKCRVSFWMPWSNACTETYISGIYIWGIHIWHVLFNIRAILTRHMVRYKNGKNVVFSMCGFHIHAWHSWNYTIIHQVMQRDLSFTNNHNYSERTTRKITMISKKYIFFFLSEKFVIMLKLQELKDVTSHHFINLLTKCGILIQTPENNLKPAYNSSNP